MIRSEEVQEMIAYQEKKETTISKARRAMMRLMEAKGRTLLMEEVEKMNWKAERIMMISEEEKVMMRLMEAKGRTLLMEELEKMNWKAERIMMISEEEKVMMRLMEAKVMMRLMEDAGKDELKGGEGADRFVCDKTDKIIDYNSLENDIIVGKCKYEDKGLIPKPIPDKGPLFSNSQISDNRDNNFKLSSKDSVVPDNKDSSFEKFISKLIDINIPNILR